MQTLFGNTTALITRPATPAPLPMPRFRKAMKSLINAGRRLSNQRPKTTMRLCETLSLGDKRFLAVVSVEQQKFLVGGAANSIVLLTELQNCSPPEGTETEVQPL